MRLLSIAIAATAATLMVAPGAFAMDKMDGDAWLKMIFHGKPGSMMMMPMAPMAPMAKDAKDMGKMMMMPWDMMKKPMMAKAK